MKKGFKLQREAKEWELEFLNKYSGTVDMKFRYFVEIYLADCKVRLKPTTYPGKENMFRKHILPYFGEMKLNKITATTVRQWQTVMMSNPKKFKKNLSQIHSQPTVRPVQLRLQVLRPSGKPGESMRLHGKKQGG